MSQNIQEAIDRLRYYAGEYPDSETTTAIYTLLAHVTKPVPEDVKERAEELFDKYSVYIEDSSFDFNNVSETSIVQRNAFEKAIIQAVTEYSIKHEQPLAEKDALIEDRATGFAEWIVKMGYTRYNKHTRNEPDAWLSDGGTHFYKIADTTSDLFKLYLQQLTK